MSEDCGCDDLVIEVGTPGPQGPPGAAASDHAALSNLGYTASGHPTSGAEGFAGTGVPNIYLADQTIEHAGVAALEVESTDGSTLRARLVTDPVVFGQVAKVELTRATITWSIEHNGNLIFYRNGVATLQISSNLTVSVLPLWITPTSDAVQFWLFAFASQTNDLSRVTSSNGATIYWRTNKDGYLVNHKVSAISDADLGASQVSWHWQATVGNARPVHKGKDSAGTVVTRTAANLEQANVFQAAQDFGNFRLTNVATPTADNDGATKAYVDATSAGRDWKDSVRAATTANITLSGTQTIDGVSLSVGDRVLVKNQTAPAENGLYVVASGAWTRSTDADTSAEVTPGSTVSVEEGTTLADTRWLLTTNAPITLGTTGLTWTQDAGETIAAGAGLTKTGNTLDVGGTANRIQVLADSVDIDPNYSGQTSITTLGTIVTGTWNGEDIAVADGGTGASDAATARANLDVQRALSSDCPPHIVEGRLTLLSNNPVPRTDQIAQSTVYFTPYNGNRVRLYDGTNWKLFPFSQASLALAGLTANRPYDLYLYDNAGTPALELGPVWASDSTRGGAIDVQDRVFVKTGDPTRLYLGTIYTTGATTTEDSAAKRRLFNYYNRVRRTLKNVDATDSWTYTTDAYREANGVSNRVDCMIGLAAGVSSVVPSATLLDITALARASNTLGTVGFSTAIGEDGATPHADCLIQRGFVGVAAGFGVASARLSITPDEGFHSYRWLERSAAVGTTTWYGEDADPTYRSGLTGFIEA